MIFQDYYTFKEFSQAYDTWLAIPVTSSFIEKEKRNKIYQSFETSFLAYLNMLNEEKKLSSIINSSSHQVSFGLAWNRLVQSKNNEKDDKLIIHHFARKILHHALSQVSTIIMEKDKISEKMLLQEYEQLVQHVNQGNFESKYFHISFICEDCGQELNLSFNNWLASFHVFDERENEWNYHLPHNCSNQSIIELGINLPTGNLLVADWFRIPGFQEIMNHHSEHLSSINYTKGKEEKTIHYASHNIIHLALKATKDKLPQIFQYKNNLVAGYESHFSPRKNHEHNHTAHDESTQSYQLCGEIENRLWAVTMIEKENLIKILSLCYGNHASYVVEEYIKNNTVINIKVQPGQYILSFMGDVDNFAKSQKLNTAESWIEALCKLERNPNLNKM
jgi:hypothetical protein